MAISLLFWILMLLWLVLDVLSIWTTPTGANPAPANRFRPLGGTLLMFVLLALLGWKAFGAALYQ
jgi:hypothetical protein